MGQRLPRCFPPDRGKGWISTRKSFCRTPTVWSFGPRAVEARYSGLMTILTNSGLFPVGSDGFALWVSKVTCRYHGLLNEAVDACRARRRCLRDCTFGREAPADFVAFGRCGKVDCFRQKTRRLLCRRAGAFDKRVGVVVWRFGCHIDGLGIGKVDGALFDLGISVSGKSTAAAVSACFDAPLICVWIRRAVYPRRVDSGCVGTSNT